MPETQPKLPGAKWPAEKPSFIYPKMTMKKKIALLESIVFEYHEEGVVLAEELDKREIQIEAMMKKIAGPNLPDPDSEPAPDPHLHQFRVDPPKDRLTVGEALAAKRERLGKTPEDIAKDQSEARLPVTHVRATPQNSAHMRTRMPAMFKH